MADEQDVYATARWMATMTNRGALSAYLAAPLLSEAERALVGIEGWILGVH